MHGYDIRRWLTTSRADLWTDVKSGSVYHALSQLDREGLIELDERAVAVGRERIVYRITRSGRTELGRLIETGWDRLPRSYPSGLYLLLTFARHLAPDELRAKVQDLQGQLETARDEWTTGGQLKEAALGSASEDTTVRLVNALIANGRAHLDADVDLLRSIALLTEPRSDAPTAKHKSSRSLK
jgi:DNA-binding PadR family transcriptional regulator